MTTRCSTNPDLNLSRVLLIFLSLEKHVLLDHANATSFRILSRKHRVMRKAGVHALVKTGQYNNIYWRFLNPLKVFGQALARLCLLNFVQHQLCKYPEPRWSINVSSVLQPAQSWKRNDAQAGGDGTAGSSQPLSRHSRAFQVEEEQEEEQEHSSLLSPVCHDYADVTVTGGTG